jgi:hypothetical protein
MQPPAAAVVAAVVHLFDATDHIRDEHRTRAKKVAVRMHTTACADVPLTVFAYDFAARHVSVASVRLAGVPKQYECPRFCGRTYSSGCPTAKTEHVRQCKEARREGMRDRAIRKRGESVKTAAITRACATSTSSRDRRRIHVCTRAEGWTGRSSESGRTPPTKVGQARTGSGRSLLGITMGGSARYASKHSGGLCTSN